MKGPATSRGVGDRSGHCGGIFVEMICFYDEYTSRSKFIFGR